MKSPYDILGVEKSADSDTIKRAFKRKAAKAHPDRGGDGQQMAEINCAYETLSDPQRRQRFDETGRDGREQSVESQARDLVLKAFLQLIEGEEGNNPVDMVRDALASEQGDVRKEAQRITKLIPHIKRRRDKVKCKGPENLFHWVADKRIEQLELSLQGLSVKGQIIEQALALLKDYTGEFPPTQPASYDALAHMIYVAQTRGFGGFKA